MDHTIALRQEVAQLSSQVAAMGQVTEAVGQAVGELYQLFRAQTATSGLQRSVSSAPGSRR